MDNQSQASIIADLNSKNAQLKDNAIDQSMEIITLKAHIKESRELTDKDLIASLRHDINVRNQQLLKAGRENKTLADRNEYLEGKLKTANADGIRSVFEYAVKAEADNEQD